MKKICTDIRQSKKLIELGIDNNTADMHYTYHHWQIDENTIGSQSDASIGVDLDLVYNGESYDYIPCWSLTALLDVLPVSCDDGQHCLTLINPNPNDKTEWLCAYEDCKGDLIMECYADNSVDACYEMILKLHEFKML